MKRVVPVVAAGVAGALVAGVGVGVAAATSGGESGASPRPPAVAAAVNDTAQESRYTPVPVCALVNTQTISDVLEPNAVRTYRAAGTAGFPAQGGKVGGCGIPDAATAVQVVITAAGAAGKGSLRAAPVGATPGTFMNYTSAFDVTQSGVVALSAGRFRLQNLTSRTSVRVDVQGYFIAPMWAQIRSDGAIAASSRVVSATRIDVGRYEVVFDRDVTACGVAAQSTGLDQSDIWVQAVGAAVVVDVELPATANTQDDDSFYLTVSC